MNVKEHGLSHYTSFMKIILRQPITRTKDRPPFLKDRPPFLAAFEHAPERTASDAETLCGPGVIIIFFF